ncbi:uncharacterized protein [Paramisgurnus dabryanus]
MKDIMGLESDTMFGLQIEDIIHTIFGHVTDGYKFHEDKPLSMKDPYYKSDPSLADQSFCLVYVIAADTIELIDEQLFQKLRLIRKRISEMGIPQVIILTKVDQACPLVWSDLKKIYYSKKIKEKVEKCCIKVGVPMCNIFPVKNYHNEIDTDDDVDVLILKAFDQIVFLANERLRMEEYNSFMPLYASTSKQVKSHMELQCKDSKPVVSVEASLELEKPWRKFDWGQKEMLKRRLENFSVKNPDVKNVRILVVGQIGAGKSSFINSVSSAFQGEIINEALADATAGASKSFTKKLSTYTISNECGKELPFVFSDIMGLEAKMLHGLPVEDVISTILGHVMEDYKFKEDNPIPSGDELYNPNPSISEQIFCLLYVIAADTVQVIDDQLYAKLKIIRERVSEMGLPQVIVMTKVDEACPLVKNDLKKIYTSKKIKMLMELCSGTVGVPMNSIFPVKNYHNEIDTDDDMDVLILKALDQIVRSANEQVKKGALK